MHGQSSSKAVHHHHNTAQRPCCCYYHHHHNTTVCRHRHKQSWLSAAMCIATHLYKCSNLMHGQSSSKAITTLHNAHAATTTTTTTTQFAAIATSRVGCQLPCV